MDAINIFSSSKEIGIGIGLLLFFISGGISRIFLPLSQYKYIPTVTVFFEVMVILLIEVYGKDSWHWSKEQAGVYAIWAVWIWLLGIMIFFVIPIFEDWWKNH